MYFFYAIPILPIVLVVLALCYSGASWIRDALPVLAGLVLLKNIYIDLYYSIFKKSHNPLLAILQFLFGIARIKVFFPMLNTALTSSGGLSGLIDLILSLLIVVPILSLLWLLGEMSSYVYGTGDRNESLGLSIMLNVFSIICAWGIYFFLYH